MIRPIDLVIEHRTRAATVVAALVVCGIASTAVGPTRGAEEGGRLAQAPSTPAPAPAIEPVWVPKVMRIERAQETRQRVDEGPEKHRYLIRPPIGLATDGSFATLEGRIRIAGVRLPERSHMCRYADGRRWPCGVRAQAFFGATLGARIDCRARPGEATPPLVDCTTAQNRTVAATVVGQGWSDVDPDTADARLTAMRDKARAEGLGMWATTPP